MQRLLIPVDQVSTFIGHVFAWCIVLLTLAVSYEVFSRYVLGAPTDWAFDASYFLYGALFIMAGAYALSRNAHVRGDFLYRSWQPKTPGGDGPGSLFPVLLSRHHRLHLFRLWFCGAIVGHPRAFGL